MDDIYVYKKNDYFINKNTIRKNIKMNFRHFISPKKRDMNNWRKSYDDTKYNTTKYDNMRNTPPPGFEKLYRHNISYPQTFENFNSAATMELKFKRRRAITSYGIILYTYDFDGKIIYMLSQRRDTISYSEFVRNHLKTHEDIVKHISLMSNDERNRCLYTYRHKNFKDLWDDLWINHNTGVYRNSDGCEDAFYKNMSEYYNLFFIECKCKENPWAFPKGRRNSNETDIECALREFEEETTISKHKLEIKRINPLEDFYIGTDGRSYRTVYYLAKIERRPYIIYKSSQYIRKTYVSDEVSQIMWGSLDNCLYKLDENKRKILKTVDNYILNGNENILKRRWSR